MPPSIVVATITCRPDPAARLPDMARTLAYAAEALRGRASLTWLLVDELERDLSDLPPTGALAVRQVAPKMSPYRAKRYHTDAVLPDHNGARNTAIVAAQLLHADYIVFLDDQTVVTRSFADVVLAAAARDAGYRASIKFLRDLIVPPSGEIDAHELGGLDFVSCAPTSVAGGCFGAPLEALVGVDGFDEAYSGQYGREDVECFVRLERAGLKWQTCKRAAALQLGTGAPGTGLDRKDVTADRDAIQGKRNKVLFKKLLAARAQTLPAEGISKSCSNDFVAMLDIKLVRKSDGATNELAIGPSLFATIAPLGSPPLAVTPAELANDRTYETLPVRLAPGDVGVEVVAPGQSSTPTLIYVGTPNDVVGAGPDMSKLVMTVTGPAEAILPDVPAVDLDDLLED